MYECSIKECKERLKEVQKMDLNTLSYYSDKCSKCGEWILKENDIVNRTYNKISIKFAEEYNKKLINKKGV